MLDITLTLLLALVAMGNFLIGYGVISWQKQGTKPSEESDLKMKKIARLGGYSATVVCTTYVLEYFGFW